jgi:hypothetical protein
MMVLPAPSIIRFVTSALNRNGPLRFTPRSCRTAPRVPRLSRGTAATFRRWTPAHQSDRTAIHSVDDQPSASMTRISQWLHFRRGRVARLLATARDHHIGSVLAKFDGHRSPQTPAFVRDQGHLAGHIEQLKYRGSMVSSKHHSPDRSGIAIFGALPLGSTAIPDSLARFDEENHSKNKKLITRFGATTLLVSATFGVTSADAPDPTGFLGPVIAADGAVG